MEPYDVVVNQPVVIDNVSGQLSCEKSYFTCGVWSFGRLSKT